VVLLLGGAAVAALLFWPGDDADTTPARPGDDTTATETADPFTAWQTTSDQQRVLDEFGPPQAFIVAYGEDHLAELGGDEPLPLVRAETWDYHDMGTRFVFRDGEAMGTEDLAPIEGAPSAYYVPLFTPVDFSYGMTQADVDDFMDVEPSAEADIDPDLFDDLHIVSYFDQLYVTFEAGALIGVDAPVLGVEGGVE
jgi:hypothetical protein